jgi:hypothetical protein
MELLTLVAVAVELEITLARQRLEQTVVQV